MYRKITQKELNKIIENHKHWIMKDCIGYENMRANFSYTDLKELDLKNIDLSYADLRFSNLISIHLKDTSLDNTNLNGATLKSTIIEINKKLT